MNACTAQDSNYSAISQPEPGTTNQPFFVIKQEPKQQFEEIFIKEEALEDENPNDKKSYHDLLQATIKEEHEYDHNSEYKQQSTENFEEIFVKEQQDNGSDLSEDDQNEPIRRRKRITEHACPICEKKYPKKLELLDHMQVHSGRQTFTCPLCDLLFTSKLVLKTHIAETHSIEKGYPCPICNKGFSMKKSLKDHMETHGKNGKFECPECHRVYFQLINLKRHMMVVHFRVDCNLCGATFTRQAYLHEHITSFHHKMKLPECNICKKTFMKKSYLTRHMKNQHNKVEIEVIKDKKV